MNNKISVAEFKEEHPNAFSAMLVVALAMTWRRSIGLIVRILRYTKIAQKLEGIKESEVLKSFKADHPNANAVVIVLGIIMLWRGVWGLLDQFLFPGSPEISYMVSIGLGVLVLYLDNFSLDNLKR